MKNYIIKNLLPALFILLISAVSVNSQTTQWTNTYGTTGQDGGESMVLTDDGGIVIAGFKSTNNLKDILLMKTDSLW